MSPPSSVSISGFSVFTPAVSSQSAPQPLRSRPLVISSSASRSFSSVFPYSCFLKYAPTPAKNSWMPTHAASCLSTDPPLA